jgi:hypothetical protein
MRQATGLGALDHVADHAHHVVHDGGHRQAFDRLLQAQLQLGAAVHALSSAWFWRSRAMSTRVESKPLACATRSDRSCMPRRHGLASGHRGLKAPRHESADGGQAAHAPRAIRKCACAPVRRRRGRRQSGTGWRPGRFRLRRPARQFLQQVLRRCPLRARCHRSGGQRLFDGHDARRLPACHRQGQQGHHAVGLDLEQALHQAPGHARREAAARTAQSASSRRRGS